MNWLNINTVKELKEYGKMKEVKLIINKDLGELFRGKKSKDKNISSMITINSGSWQGLVDKIIALREVIDHLESDVLKVKIREKEAVTSHENLECNNEYFNSEESKYIYYLLELDGKQRADKLNMTMKCYSNKKEAKKWRDAIAKVVHPDKCNHDNANLAVMKLNQLYKEMVGDE